MAHTLFACSRPGLFLFPPPSTKNCLDVILSVPSFGKPWKVATQALAAGQVNVKWTTKDGYYSFWVPKTASREKECRGGCQPPLSVLKPNAQDGCIYWILSYQFPDSKNALFVEDTIIIFIIIFCWQSQAGYWNHINYLQGYCFYGRDDHCSWHYNKVNLESLNKIFYIQHTCEHNIVYINMNATQVNWCWEILLHLTYKCYHSSRMYSYFFWHAVYKKISEVYSVYSEPSDIWRTAVLFYEFETISSWVGGMLLWDIELLRFNLRRFLFFVFFLTLHFSWIVFVYVQS